MPDRSVFGQPRGRAAAPERAGVEPPPLTALPGNAASR